MFNNHLGLTTQFPWSRWTKVHSLAKWIAVSGLLWSNQSPWPLYHDHSITVFDYLFSYTTRPNFLFVAWPCPLISNVWDSLEKLYSSLTWTIFVDYWKCWRKYKNIWMKYYSVMKTVRISFILISYFIYLYNKVRSLSCLH